MATESVVEIPVLAPTGSSMTEVVADVINVRGARVGVLAQASPLMIDLVIKRMRKAVLPGFEKRLAIIERAANIHANAMVTGLGPDEFAGLQAQTSGLPISVAHRHLSSVGAATRCLSEAIGAQRTDAVVAVEHPLAAAPTLTRVRRGDVAVVLAPANHPDVHLSIMEAFAYGYRVAVRPSSRDPFTPARIVEALRLAGAPQDSVALIPCGHDQVQHLMRTADRTIVYGGDDVVRRHTNNPDVLAQGPGRSKLYATDASDPQLLREWIMRSFAADGGTQCVNASVAIVAAGLAGVADDVEEHANRLVAAPPEDPAAQLPTLSLTRAKAVAEYAVAAHRSTRSAADLIVDFGDGSAALRPLVSTSTDVGDIAATPELAFPAIRIVTTADRIEPGDLGRTLVLAVHSSRSDAEFRRFVSHPSIRNVFFGATPTTAVLPGMPHDGALADFLMETKTVIHST